MKNANRSSGVVWNWSSDRRHVHVRSLLLCHYPFLFLTFYLSLSNSLRTQMRFLTSLCFFFTSRKSLLFYFALLLLVSLFVLLKAALLLFSFSPSASLLGNPSPPSVGLWWIPSLSEQIYSAKLTRLSVGINFMHTCTSACTEITRNNLSALPLNLSRSWQIACQSEVWQTRRWQILTFSRTVPGHVYKVCFFFLVKSSDTVLTFKHFPKTNSEVFEGHRDRFGWLTSTMESVKTNAADLTSGTWGVLFRSQRFWYI